jgi:hypothetical protein
MAEGSGELCFGRPQRPLRLIWAARLNGIAVPDIAMAEQIEEDA